MRPSIWLCNVAVNDPVEVLSPASVADLICSGGRGRRTRPLPPAIALVLRFGLGRAGPQPRRIAVVTAPRPAASADPEPACRYRAFRPGPAAIPVALPLVQPAHDALDVLDQVVPVL